MVVTATALAATFGVTVGSMLLGDAKLLLGDVIYWANGRSGPVITYVLDARFPRVLAALLAGAALAVAGALFQAVCRNPLAEPGILGVSGGAGIGGVLVITVAPLASAWQLTAAAAAGAIAASALVFGLSFRKGLSADRLVLIGFGVFYGALAVIAFIIVYTDPFNSTKALTWLSGSTYGRTLSHVAPVGVALLAAIPVLAGSRHELDLLALDDDTPRGRTVIAPGQLPAGLLTAIIGAPYFVWLLWRSRTAAAQR